VFRDGERLPAFGLFGTEKVSGDLGARRSPAPTEAYDLRAQQRLRTGTVKLLSAGS